MNFWGPPGPIRPSSLRLDGEVKTIYGYPMSTLVKTTVYLTEREYSRLKELAREQNRPTAELVREAVAEYAHRHAHHRLPESLGSGKSGRGDLSERAEELLDGMGR